MSGRLVYLSVLITVAYSTLGGVEEFVDTRIGAKVGLGSCLVGPCLPHASVYPSPDGVWPCVGHDKPPPNGWYGDEKVVGFSQLHAQGTGGVPSYGLFRVIFGGPSSLELRETHPYRFSGCLTDLGIEVEIAPTHNGAIYRYSKGSPTVDYRCKVGKDVASSNAWMKVENDTLFGGGTYSGNWNPAPYDCYFYATRRENVFRIAVSFASVEEAHRFHDEELKGRTLDEIAGEAQRIWGKRLSKIQVGGVGSDELRRFYTHLFHAYVQPRRRGENWDDQYTVWDTWKTLYPLMILLEPEETADMINSFSRRFREGGRCETAFIQGREMRVGQGGDDVDNVIADALAKGVKGIDWDGAWAVLDAHAQERTPEYRERGWVASDVPNNYCWRMRSASSTLSFAYNDWCAATVAEHLRKSDAARDLYARSASWTNVWNASLLDVKSGFSGFAWGRRQDGSFGSRHAWSGDVEPLDPRGGYNGSFYEGTGWEYSFNVWHDIPTLIEKCGGRECFVKRLEYALENGLIDFRNEPSFYTPWLFSLAGRQDLTKKWAHKVEKSFPLDGAPGDDDSGAMGSFYVFLKLGIMPIAGTDAYISHGTEYPNVSIYTDGGVVRLSSARKLPPVLHHRQLLAADFSRVRCEGRIGTEGYGEYDWWLDRLQSRRQAVREAGGEFDLVLLGDSITHNFGPRPEIGDPPPGFGALQKLEKEFRVLNCGYSGDGTAHLLWRLRNGELEGVDAKCVSLLIGTNDAWGNPEDTAAGVQAILKEIELRLPRATVLLHAIFPRGAGADEYVRRTNDRVNELIRPFADGKRVLWVDLRKKFLDEKGDTRWIMLDRLHPNEKGYEEIWLPVLLPLVRKICGDVVLPDIPNFELTLRKAPNSDPVTVSRREAVRWCRRTDGVEYFFSKTSPVKSVVALGRIDSEGAHRYRIDVSVADGWHLEVSAYPIVNVSYPLSGDGADDRFLVGATVGGVWKTKEVAVGHPNIYPYPGSLAAQFCAAWDEDQGYYFAAEDAIGFAKRFGFVRLENSNRFIHERRGWDTGTVTGAYDVVARFVRRTDEPLVWEDFADIYRVWLLRQPWMSKTYLERSDVPDWMRRAPAMTRYSRQWLGKPESIAASIDWWKRTFGTNDVIAAVWGWEKVGTWWGPDYFPAYPNDETIKSETAMMRAAGFHPFAWPSCYNWSECIGRRDDGTYRHDYRETYMKEAADMRCVNRDGSFHRRQAPWMENGAYATICGGQPKARAWLRELGRGLADRGFDMIQFDQSAGARLCECWSQTHGHEPGMGSWSFAAFMESYRELRAGLEEVWTNGCVCVEQPHEQFTGFSHLQDYRDVEDWANSCIGVYSYLHHGYMPMFQSNPYRDNLFALAHMAVDGQIPFYKILDEDLAERRLALKNGGFETRSDNARMGALCWEVAGRQWLSRSSTPDEPMWDFEGAACVLGTPDWEDRHGGAVSYLMDAEKGSEQCGQTVRDLAKGEYILSAWVKTERAGGTGAILWGNGDGEEGRIQFPPVGAGWQKVSAKIRAEGKLRIILFAGVGVRAKVDDVELTLIDGTPVYERGESIYLRMMRRWIELYQGEGRDFLAYGFREKPPRLTCGSFKMAGCMRPTVVCGAYRSADGRRALAIANATDESQSFDCVWRGQRLNRVLQPAEIVLLPEKQ